MAKRKFTDNTVTIEEYDEVMEIVKGRCDWLYGEVDSHKLRDWCNANNFYFWSVLDYFDGLYK